MFSNYQWFKKVVTSWNVSACVDSFIDIGVGIENSEAWIMSEAGFDKSRIIGFEPHRGRFKHLEDLYPGTLFNLAVSSQDCILPGLEGGDGDDGDDFIAQFIDKEHCNMNNRTSVNIESVCVDSIIFNNNLEAAAVWADVEGSEYLVIAGAIRSLMHGKISVVFLELRNNQTSLETVKLLSKFNYYPAACSGVSDNGRLEDLPGREGGMKEVIVKLYLPDDNHADVAFIRDPTLEGFDIPFSITSDLPDNHKNLPSRLLDNDT